MKAKIETGIVELHIPGADLYLVNVRVQVTEGGMANRRFIMVGTRVFTDISEAYSAAENQEDMYLDQLEKNWLEETDLMDPYGPWREIPAA